MRMGIRSIKTIAVIILLGLLSVSIIGCSANTKYPENIKEITEESAKERIENSKKNYRGDKISKEDLQRYIEDSIGAIDKNIPIIEENIAELETNRESIINNIDLERLYKQDDRLITNEDSLLKKEGVLGGTDNIIKDLRYVNKKLEIELIDSFEQKLDNPDHDKQFLESRKKAINDGEITMDTEFDNIFNREKSKIQSYKSRKNYLEAVYNQLGQESISLNDVQKSILKDMVEKNDKNIEILENALSIAKDGDSKSNSKAILTKVRKELKDWDNFGLSEANIIRENELKNHKSVDNSTDSNYYSDYKGIRNANSVLADTMDANLSISDWFEKDVLKSIDSDNSFQPFYGLFDEPNNYVRDKEALLYDFTDYLSDLKVRIEEYNNTLKYALLGKNYDINNDYLNNIMGIGMLDLIK